MTAKPQWLPCSIPGYEVSSAGQVRDASTKEERTLSMHNKGYLRVSLGKKYCYAHRLVAEAFHGKPESKQQVNHKNGQKTDNRASNLEWVTARENIQHGFRLGLCPRGEQRILAKLSEIAVRAIRASKEPQTALAKIYGVHQVTISKVQRRSIWKHVQ